MIGPGGASGDCRKETLSALSKHRGRLGLCPYTYRRAPVQGIASSASR